jgi:quercetin dioxygenase-like cupin family protein
MPITDVRLVHHTEGESHPVMGDPMRFIMTAAQTGAAYAIAEQEVRPGNGAPPHIHHNEDESFYVLEGDFSVLLADKVHSLKAGDFIHIPRGTVRGFTNTGTTSGRVLILHVPGSASGFYIGMGKLPFPPKLEDIAVLAAEHGIEMVMPEA